MATETVSRLLTELKQRRDELRPLVEELNQIESAISALEQVGGGRVAGSGRRRGSGKGRPSGGRPRRGRPPKGQPTRSDQFLALVEQRPGISISEAATELSIEPNYLYRVSATLQREGTIAKEGRGFVPAVAAAPAAGAEVIEAPLDGSSGEPPVATQAEGGFDGAERSV
ncbi:MAG: hypothetical protein H0V55_05425 [Thermoleophilaceae bacterium]|nr:hypothetical protein [Thermoleophilaceae bacterium]